MQAAKLLRASVREGTATLGTLAEGAVKRLLESKRPRAAKRLFTDDERQQLADILAATNASAELLGRARIRKRLEQAEQHAEKFREDSPTDFACFDDKPIKPLAPHKAIEWFRSLFPGLKAPASFADKMKDAAFKLAATTEETLLGKVHGLILKALESGEKIRETPKLIASVLDDAGVSPSSPAYAENIFRTGMMQAYNTGAEQEMRELGDAFPVWRYVGIADGRQRPAHAKHFDKYFPSSVSFAEVRDSVAGKFDGYQCRCSFIPVHRNQWKRLQEAGAQVSRFSETFCDPGTPEAKPGPCPEGGGDSEGKEEKREPSARAVKDYLALRNDYYGRIQKANQDAIRARSPEERAKLRAQATSLQEETEKKSQQFYDSLPGKGIRPDTLTSAGYEIKHAGGDSFLVRDPMGNILSSPLSADSLRAGVFHGPIPGYDSSESIEAHKAKQKEFTKRLADDWPDDPKEQKQRIKENGGPEKVFHLLDKQEKKIEPRGKEPIISKPINDRWSLAYNTGTEKYSVQENGAKHSESLARFAEPCELPRGLIELPDVPQDDASSCGAAASMAIGRFYGVGPTDLAAWKKLLGTSPEDGTPPDAIARVLRGLGLSVEMRQGMTLDDLRQCWREGAPVLCPIQDYSPDIGPDDYADGHWICVVGFLPGYVVVQDSMADVELEGANSVAAPGKVLIEEGRFMDVWHDEDGEGKKYVRFGIIVRGKDEADRFSEDYQLYADLTRLADCEWRTIGAHAKKGQEDKRGGTPVCIGEGGAIEKGPGHMAGKRPTELGKKNQKNSPSPLDNKSPIGDNSSGGGNGPKPEEPKMSPKQLLDMAVRDEYSSILPQDLLKEYVSKLTDAEDGLEEGDFEPFQDFVDYLKFLSTTHDGQFAKLGDLIRADAKFIPNQSGYTSQEREWMKKPGSNRGRLYKSPPGR